MKPYKISPTAGTIVEEKIVGREKEIEKLKLLLEAQSVVIEEMRRMGKTFLIKKLAYKCKDTNNKAIYFFLQGTKDLVELTEMIFSELRKEQSFGKLKIAFNGIKRLYNTFKPEEIDLDFVSFKLPEWKTNWKAAFSALLEDIAERNNEKDEILTIILDEFPVMIWDWMEAGKANEAMEFLDILRKQRQTLEAKGKVRFVICGSIGLQVVLKHLKQKYNYMGEPFNETETFALEAMSSEDALFLCECLYLADFEIDNEINKAEYFQKIIEFAEGLPFYINKVFTILQQSHDSTLSEANVKSAFDELLTSPNHFKTFKHLHDRLTIYYADESLMMIKILNLLANKTTKISEKEIIEGVEGEAEKIKEALMVLVSEQYLRRSFDENGRKYIFKYQLFKKWWKLNKA
jgi:ribosomal protein S6